METRIFFGNKKLQKEYETLKDERLRRSLDKAFKNIEEDPAIGIPLEKYRIPKGFVTKGYDNIWKYNLPGAWRLIYSLQGDRITILAIILEWCKHGEYQRKYSGKRK